jgi:TorA maturation chaperone TorD
MIDAEEQGRADLYGVLARLFYGPPDAALLRAIADTRIEGELAKPWGELSHAAAAADPEALREEYEHRFVGTGKAPVTLYTSAYTVKFSNETPLAALRGELASLGVGRRADVSEPEDHIAALCECMRFFIAVQERPLEDQQRFFSRWISPAFRPLCDAIDADGEVVFYRRVGNFARRFFEIEQSAFEML